MPSPGVTRKPSVVLALLAAASLLGLSVHETPGAAVQTPAAVEPEAALPVAVLDAPVPPKPVAPPGPTLSARMQRVLEYTAKRYRLSPLALEPAFAAAERSARELGLDPLLIVAVIGIESGFNPFAESIMGAQGLMQIIPRYHSDKLPQDVRNGADAATAFFDPVMNVRVGARALHEFIRDTGGLVEGLQQFAGAPDDPEEAYADKVLAEVERLESLAGARAVPARR